MSKSYSAKPGEIERQWVVVDVDGLVLGRAATEIAMILRGKHRPTFTPHVDTGDFVVVVNAEKVKLTGKKTTDKKYYTHSGYIGSLRATTAGQLLKEHPDRVFRSAVRGMLPKNTLGRSLLKKLKIYAGPDHPHAAQKPTPHRLSAKE